MVKATSTSTAVASQLHPITLESIEGGFGERQISISGLRQSLVGFLANLHRSTANTKKRGQVSGGGRKPWRQKGTGRARVGSSRTPVWRGGGVVFGPSTARNFQHDLTKTLRSKALLDALWIKLSAGEVFHLPVESAVVKTKEAANLIGNPTRPTLVVVNTAAEGKAFSNIQGVILATPAHLNLLGLSKAHKIVFVGSAWEAFRTRIK